MPSFDPTMAQAVYQAVKKGLIQSGLRSSEASRIALSVQDMYQGGQLPSATNPPQDPSAIYQALNKGLGQDAGVAESVGNILTGDADPGIPESFLSPERGVWAPPLPRTQEIEVPPAPISQLSGVMRRDPAAQTLQKTDYLYGGQMPVAITPPRELPIAANMAAGGGAPSTPQNSLGIGDLLKRILAAISGGSPQATPGIPPAAPGATGPGPSPPQNFWHPEATGRPGELGLPMTGYDPNWFRRMIGRAPSPPVVTSPIM